MGQPVIDTLENFLDLVRALCEEWGLSSVLVSLPLEWEIFASQFSEQGRLPFAFITDDTVCVSVFRQGIRQVHYETTVEKFLPRR